MHPSWSWLELKEGSPCFSARKSAQTGPGVQRDLVSSAASGLSAWLRWPQNLCFCLLLSAASFRLTKGVNLIGSVWPHHAFWTERSSQVTLSSGWCHITGVPLVQTGWPRWPGDGGPGAPDTRERCLPGSLWAWGWSVVGTHRALKHSLSLCRARWANFSVCRLYCLCRSCLRGSWGRKAATDSTEVDGCVPVKLHLQKQAVGQTRPMRHGCLLDSIRYRALNLRYDSY